MKKPSASAAYLEDEAFIMDLRRLSKELDFCYSMQPTDMNVFIHRWYPAPRNRRASHPGITQTRYTYGCIDWRWVEKRKTYFVRVSGEAEEHAFSSLREAVNYLLVENRF